MVTPYPVLLGPLTGLIALGMLLMAGMLVARAITAPEPLYDKTTGEMIPKHAWRSRDRRLVLGVAVLLLLWVFAGRFGALVLRESMPRHNAANAFPPITKRVKAPSGAVLAVTETGPDRAPRLVFTHGWGADRREWTWARESLGMDFRLVTWDLPGLGESSEIPDGVYSMERMARDLEAVVEATGESRALLVGHSIGGMLQLTAAKNRGGQLPPNVEGMVLLNTTYTNPTNTVQGHNVSSALQGPVYEPLLHVVRFTSPLVQGLNWLSYTSGLAHLQNATRSFAGQESAEQLDFASAYYYRSSPSVVAKGVLAMMHWDASDVLRKVTAPVLVVTGYQDVTTLPEASVRIHRQMPHASLVGVDRAAHLGPIERHEVYNEAIRNFATGVFEGGTAVPSAMARNEGQRPLRW